jgi:hypothetical protein
MSSYQYYLYLSVLFPYYSTTVSGASYDLDEVEAVRLGASSASMPACMSVGDTNVGLNIPNPELVEPILGPTNFDRL